MVGSVIMAALVGLIIGLASSLLVEWYERRR